MSYGYSYREKLFHRAGGKCEYCGCPMVLIKNKNGKGPDNMATLDHKYAKSHPLRFSPNINQERRIFIVCKKCNEEKSKTENPHIPPEIMWEKSNRYPSDMNPKNIAYG